jgi:hypothetical protein
MTNEWHYDLPEEFYKQIEPYVRNNKPRLVIDTPLKLITLWQSAIKARKEHPDKQELIAEWTMSAGANSPLVKDNDTYENIHCEFGSLEVTSEDKNEADWRKIEESINNLVNE